MAHFYFLSLLLQDLTGAVSGTFSLYKKRYLSVMLLKAVYPYAAKMNSITQSLQKTYYYKATTKSKPQLILNPKRRAKRQKIKYNLL